MHDTKLLEDQLYFSMYIALRQEQEYLVFILLTILNTGYNTSIVLNAIIFQCIKEALETKVFKVEIALDKVIIVVDICWCKLIRQC